MSARASSDQWLEPLVASLRSELQEFGGLIRLLNEERDVLHAGLTLVTEAIERQKKIAADASSKRMERMTLPDGSESTEVDIIVAAPQALRPLLGALFAEVATLAVRAKETEIQNAWLRKRLDDPEASPPASAD